MTNTITTVYEDDSLVVLHKPSGLETQNFIHQQSLEIINRLDQRVSGLLLAAKNKQTAAALNQALQNQQLKKCYKAVVANLPNITEAFLEHWHTKDFTKNKAKIFDKSTGTAKPVKLYYKHIQSSQKYHLLHVELFTGRFHQIRAQLAFIKCPIVGDVKYGFARTTPDGSIFLQSSAIAFTHPITGVALQFELPLPEAWKKYGIE